MIITNSFVCVFFSERFIIIIETIHSILLVLNDDDDQTNSTRISLLEQLGQSSRFITSMIDNCDNNNNDDNLDLVCIVWSDLLCSHD